MLKKNEIEAMKSNLLQAKESKKREHRGRKRNNEPKINESKKDKLRVHFNQKGELSLRNFCWLFQYDLKCSYNFIFENLTREMILQYAIQEKWIRISEGEPKIVGEGLERKKVKGRRRYYVKKDKKQEFIHFFRKYIIAEEYDY